MDSGIIDVSIFKEQGSIKNVYEKFSYFVNSQKTICNIGSCTSLIDVLKTIEKYTNQPLVNSFSTKK